MIFRINKKTILEAVELSPDLTQDDFNNGIYDITNDHSKLLELQGDINQKVSEKLNSNNNHIDSLTRAYGNLDYNQQLFIDQQLDKNKYFDNTLNKAAIAAPIVSGIIGAGAGYGSSVLAQRQLNKNKGK